MPCSGGPIAKNHLSISAVHNYWMRSSRSTKTDPFAHSGADRDYQNTTVHFGARQLSLLERRHKLPNQVCQDRRGPGHQRKLSGSPTQRFQPPGVGTDADGFPRTRPGGARPSGAGANSGSGEALSFRHNSQDRLSVCPALCALEWSFCGTVTEEWLSEHEVAA